MSGEYRVLVAKTDADGNDLGGIRSTTLRAPVATYTGWNVRRAGFAEGELCGLSGSFIPFARTREDRIASGDPRPSILERYGSHAGFVEAVERAASELIEEGFLLPEDAERLVNEADRSDVGG